MLIALWFLVLVAALAAGLAATARTETHLARNLVEEARARHLAEAGVIHAILALLDREAGVADGYDAGDETIRLFATELRIRVRDECGKVDLNTGWGGLLSGLLTAVAGEKAGFAIGQAILDWRDPDDRRRVGGAEDADYAAAGLSYGAGDGLFESIGELQQVMGMTPELYARLAPEVTVECLGAGIDPLAASPLLLAAVPGMVPGVLDRFLETRRAAATTDVEAPPPPPLPEDAGKYLETSPGQAFTVEVTAVLPSGATVPWSATVWLTGDGDGPVVFRRWQRGAADGGS